MNAPDRILDGLMRDLPAEVYHAHEALSNGGAKKILRSPQHYRLMRTTANEQTAAMQLGTCCHTGILEPDRFASTVVQAPELNRRTNVGKADYEAFCAAHAGKIILSADDMKRAQACISAVRAHPAAMKLLTRAEVELSLFWRDGRYDVPCKARWDARNHGGVIDVKTCADASPEGFSRAIGSFLYNLQAAFYFSGGEHVLGETPTFFCFIAVETEPPFSVACYELDTPSILAGMNLADEALRRYAEALQTGQWRGYPETIQRINAPRWMLRDMF